MRIAGERVSKWSGFAAAVVLSLPILFYLGVYVETVARTGNLELGYFIAGLILVGILNVFWFVLVAAAGGVASFVWLALLSLRRSRD